MAKSKFTFGEIITILGDRAHPSYLEAYKEAELCAKPFMQSALFSAMSEALC